MIKVSNIFGLLCEQHDSDADHTLVWRAGASSSCAQHSPPIGAANRSGLQLNGPPTLIVIITVIIMILWSWLAVTALELKAYR